MITAWQLPISTDLADERPVRFGKMRHSLSISVTENDGFYVEARIGRTLITKIACGYDKSALPGAISRATEIAQAKILEML